MLHNTRQQTLACWSNFPLREIKKHPATLWEVRGHRNVNNFVSSSS